jgi:hypothetical protein
MVIAMQQTLEEGELFGQISMLSEMTVQEPLESATRRFFWGGPDWHYQEPLTLSRYTQCAYNELYYNNSRRERRNSNVVWIVERISDCGTNAAFRAIAKRRNSERSCSSIEQVDVELLKSSEGGGTGHDDTSNPTHNTTRRKATQRDVHQRDSMDKEQYIFRYAEFEADDFDAVNIRTANSALLYCANATPHHTLLWYTALISALLWRAKNCSEAINSAPNSALLHGIHLCFAGATAIKLSTKLCSAARPSSLLCRTALNSRP